MTQDKKMTVKDMRSLLEQLPDDMTVVDPNGYPIESVKPEKWVRGIGFLQETTKRVTIR